MAQRSQSGRDKSLWSTCRDKSLWSTCVDCRGLKILNAAQICVHPSINVSYSSKHFKIRACGQSSAPFILNHHNKKALLFVIHIKTSM